MVLNLEYITTATTASLQFTKSQAIETLSRKTEVLKLKKDGWF